MRIVIDLQGAQTGSRTRGIGRYALSLALAVTRNRGAHEIHIALNDLFPETIEPLRAAFMDILPERNIHVWSCEGPVAATDAANDTRRVTAEVMREAFLAWLRPDMVLITSLFEGLGDNAALSVGRLANLPTAVVLYDLIPLIHAKVYLGDPRMDAWYRERLEHLRRADLLLAISESSRLEALEWLGFPADNTINISSGCDTHFVPHDYSPDEQAALRHKYGLKRPFLMYTGGIDYRKNIEGLIRAYARLPAGLRASHQLAVVCSIHAEQKERLVKLAREVGLADDELVLTGFVPEDDLVTLYNTCTLFVFPSWHEGFGLPALEAMRCGKAVLAANTTSLPEVIGHADALFDPHDEDAIAAKIQQALTDPGFREMLERHGPVQAQRFGWDDTAQRAIVGMEQWHERQSEKFRQIASTPTQPEENARPRLAYVSPLPPERSGISDYSAELLRELIHWYEIDVIADQAEINDAWIHEHCKVRDLAWLRSHHHDYARVLYHFGNSQFHQHMFALIEEIPGVVVLHDFFLSSIQAHRDFLGLMPQAWVRALQISHGYHTVKERFVAKDKADVVWAYPANLPVLQDALGIIVHSENSRTLAEHWYGVGSGADWFVIPHLRTPPDALNRHQARNALGLADNSTLVCAFGLLGATKLNHRLLSSFLASQLADDTATELVFVGGNEHGDYGQQLLEDLQRSGLKKRIRVTGWVDMPTFRTYLAAADIGVQLRTLSRGETSGTVLDCMNHGLATIVNANGSMADLDPEGVLLLPDKFEDQQLIEALEALWRDHAARAALGAHAQRVIREKHAPATCAANYADAIELIYRRDRNTLGGMMRSLNVGAMQDDEQMRLAVFMAKNFPPAPRPRQILVDVSELVQHDMKSGIQRVVRAILREWLENPPHGFQVEPVYATQDTLGYRYARRFTCRFLGIPDDWALDETVEAWSGDIFFGLDLHLNIQVAQRSYYQALRRRGGKVYFMVYDLLPLQTPQYFPPDTAIEFTEWLTAISENDGVLSISATTAKALENCMAAHLTQGLRPFDIQWSHIGADIESSNPSLGLPPDANSVLAKFDTNPTFLMVSTIEPRKRHDMVLEAFEQLWQEGMDVNLVIVGKQGWMVEALIERMRIHPQSGKHFFWLNGISDEYLEKVYRAASCLIAASEAEGFGLPLIEAARHNLPIMARDIPVFREVAGEHAYYFSGTRAEDLANSIKDWLQLAGSGMTPPSSAIPWLTWKESARGLMEKIMKMNPSTPRT
jgi:glycosyltransferase involved in cell wall biosynthesis